MVHLKGCIALDRRDSWIRYPYATVTFIDETFAQDDTVLVANGNVNGVGIRLQEQMVNL